MTRLLRENLAACAGQQQDQLVDCLNMCTTARRYIFRCNRKIKEYTDRCSSTENADDRKKGMLDKFTVLLYTQLKMEYDVELRSLGTGIRAYNTPMFDYAVLERANYVLERLNEDKDHGVRIFLRSVHKPSPITFQDNLLNWGFAEG